MDNENNVIDYEHFTHLMLDTMEGIITTASSIISDVMIRDTIKNNDPEATAFTASYKDGGNIVPSVYSRPLYDEYLTGKASIEELAERTVRVLETGHTNRFDFNVDSVNPEVAGNHLYLQLINGNTNREIAEKCACIRLNDLIAVPRWSVNVGNGDFGSILITRDIQTDLLRMTDSEILKVARDNTMEKNTFTIKGMNETLRDIIGEDMPEEMLAGMLPPMDGPEQMYVMTNETKFYGAVGLLNKDTLAAAKEKIGEDYFIIPSSVHETLFIPESRVSDPADLKAMCMGVNASQVPLADQLGSNIYHCNGHDIKICNNIDDLTRIKASAAEKIDFSDTVSRKVGRGM